LRARNVKKAPNAVYTTEELAVDPDLIRVQPEAIGREDWWSVAATSGRQNWTGTGLPRKSVINLDSEIKGHR